jgi:hypothetical protein
MLNDRPKRPVILLCAARYIDQVSPQALEAPWGGPFLVKRITKLT